MPSADIGKGSRIYSRNTGGADREHCSLEDEAEINRFGKGEGRQKNIASSWQSGGGQKGTSRNL